MGRLSAKKATEKEKHCGLAKALNPNRKEVACPRIPIVVATLVIGEAYSYYIKALFKSIYFVIKYAIFIV